MCALVGALAVNRIPFIELDHQPLQPSHPDLQSHIRQVDCGLVWIDLQNWTFFSICIRHIELLYLGRFVDKAVLFSLNELGHKTVIFTDVCRIKRKKCFV